MQPLSKSRAETLFFSVTIFLSAGLLFAVQPMLGKMMLPLVGGSPSGWLTALAFFQLALLAGYLLAHWFSKFSARGQAWGTVAVLLFGTLLLPPNFTVAEGANIGNVEQVLWLLFRAIFVPYLGLATVSSGLQRLYAARQGGADPYFLYAASNAGSFVGLLAYPLIVEPLLPLSSQRILWTVGYGLLLILIALLAGPRLQATQSAPTPTQQTATAASQISWRQRGSWVLLAFIPSSLSMGLTSLITADFGSIPLLWVIPLGLYLLTFVLAFSEKQFIDVHKLGIARQVSIALLILLYLRGENLLIQDWYLVFLPIMAFFLTALWGHMRLAAQRPGQERLTEFYLWLSLGGALGGCFNAFVAPLIFAYAVEFYAVLVLSLFWGVEPKLHGFFKDNKVVHTILVLLLCFLYTGTRNVLQINAFPELLAYAVVGLALCAMAALPRQLLVVGLLAGTMVSPLLMGVGTQAVARNFFGTYRIVDRYGVNGKTYRMMYHGAMVEGMQTVAPEAITVPHIYFWPMHDLFQQFKYRDVAMLGFGTGTALCFNDGTQHFTVYEINPLVVELGRQWFSYLSRCGEPTWRIGDARLTLAQDKQAQYDLIFLDAFSSASIPSQLITREAVQLYQSRLRSGGMMVWNVNSMYYDLALPLASIAHDTGWQAWKRYDEVGDFSTDNLPSHFVLLARAEDDLSVLRNFGWEQLPKPDFPIWRDDFTNILAALRVMKNAKAQ